MSKSDWTPHDEFDVALWDGYLAVQKSGLTNMFACNTVADLALDIADVMMDRDDVIYIIKHYEELREYFGYDIHGDWPREEN